jgi:multidrug efflux pump subunit AcrB
MKLARRVRDEARKVHGSADVRIAQRLDAPYLIIDVDRQKAANVGLSAREVILQVVAAMNSSVSISRNFWIDPRNGNQYFVGVQYQEDPHATLEKLENIFATGTNQPEPVTLSTLVTIRSETGAVEANHVSLYRTFNVLVNTEGRDIGGVAGDLEERLKPLDAEIGERRARLGQEADRLRDRRDAASRARLEQLEHELKGLRGLRWEMHGEYGRMTSSFQQLLGGLALAAVLVYLLQVALFRSWVGPFIIMFTVPLGLIGVLTMLFLTRTTLNIQSEMGVIFLVGIAVNNGVLLVEFANQQRKLGAGVRQAITTAAGIRFRPIVMTFLATFLDLVPMAIGIGQGSEATIPLARAVVGGLLTSTCLTLFVVPILYTLLIKEGEASEADIEDELRDEPPAPIAVPHPALAAADGHVLGATGIAAVAEGHGSPEPDVRPPPTGPPGPQSG